MRATQISKDGDGPFPLHIVVERLDEPEDDQDEAT